MLVLPWTTKENYHKKEKVENIYNIYSNPSGNLSCGENSLPN